MVSRIAHIFLSVSSSSLSLCRYPLRSVLRNPAFTHDDDYDECNHSLAFRFFSSPIRNAAACSLLVRHEKPYSECWRNCCTSALCECIDSIDCESNRRCVYIRLHLAWGMSAWVERVVHNLNTRSSNIWSERRRRTTTIKYSIRIHTSKLYFVFCYSLAFHSF